MTIRELQDKLAKAVKMGTSPDTKVVLFVEAQVPGFGEDELRASTTSAKVVTAAGESRFVIFGDGKPGPI